MTTQILPSAIGMYLPDFVHGVERAGAQRRHQHQIDTLRSKTLASAAEVLAAIGHDRLSLKLIADHAKVGIASIYYYFASKDELLTSLAIQGFEDLRRDMIHFGQVPDFTSPMSAATNAFLMFAEEQPELLSLMFSERLMARSADLRQAEQATLEAYCAAVEADERFPRQHRRNAARAVWVLGRGIANMAASYPDRRIPREIFADLLAGASFLIQPLQPAETVDRP